MTTGDPATVVAVLDTGVLNAHPDFGDEVTEGYDFIRNTDSSMDGDGIDPDPEDIAPDINPCNGSQNVYHGTHVAGTIGAIGNNAIGIAGVAYDTLMHLGS